MKDKDKVVDWKEMEGKQVTLHYGCDESKDGDFTSEIIAAKDENGIYYVLAEKTMPNPKYAGSDCISMPCGPHGDEA